MKHTMFTRIFALALAFVLVLGTIPAAYADTLTDVPEKGSAPAESTTCMDTTTAGGDAPTLNASLDSYKNTNEKENNNSLENAQVVYHGNQVYGSTKSSDKVDLYKLNLTEDTHLSLASFSNSLNMWFGLLDSNGKLLEICGYAGQSSDGWNIDSLFVYLPKGTYYVQVQQQKYGSTPAYSGTVSYVIEFHGHTPSGSPTGDIYNKYHSYTASCCGGTVYEKCYFKGGRCVYCGIQPYSFVYRIAGDDRFQTSISIANTLKEEMGVSKFNCIVVANSEKFPDALAGSYLCAVKKAPLLLTKSSKNSTILDYISNNLAAGGTVYILGGSTVVDDSFANGLTSRNISWKRLAGDDRYETNLRILEEAGVSAGQNLLVCTGSNYADSLSASATGLPILLVGNSLTNAQKSFLESAGCSFTIIGGYNAVSSSMESELSRYGTINRRLAGDDRYVTSTLVARAFFSQPTKAVLAYAKNFPDGLCGGPLAYTIGAPLLLTSKEDTYYNITRNYTMSVGLYQGYVLGGSNLISDTATRWILDMNRTEPVPVK